MSDVALKVENLSKQYRLGLIGSGTLQADLQRWWASMRGKEDPLLKIGESNKLDQVGDDYVWALQDINFEVKKGEILGIIGKNGAGKSTLLKILSKVTAPTQGKIYVNGRIASLLEVGTGFHPELTGRENIFLNGAILGMKKQEIKSKLDEIVAFAGVEKYLDTPVKRYSSGMYVRLAFAVAAHLEVDILIVDEVLAVGDMEFQRKALGKMQDVSSKNGRTVLFVSHNMDSINRLCKQTVYMDKGQISKIGSTAEIIEQYNESWRKVGNKDFFKFNVSYMDLKSFRRTGSCQKELFFKKINIGKCDFFSSDKMNVELLLSNESLRYFQNIELAIAIKDYKGKNIYHLSSDFIGENIKKIDTKEIITNFIIPNLNLYPGNYSITIFCETEGVIQDWIEEAITFSITGNIYGYNNIKKINSPVFKNFEFKSNIR